jgi:hypothetical protein
LETVGETFFGAPNIWPLEKLNSFGKKFLGKMFL